MERKQDEIHIQTQRERERKTYRNTNTKEIANKRATHEKGETLIPTTNNWQCKIRGKKITHRIKNAYSSFILNTLVHPAMLSGNETALGTHRESKRTHCQLPFCTN
jgi:hypothetical protein